MGKLTISTGPFSVAITRGYGMALLRLHKLPQRPLDVAWPGAFWVSTIAFPMRLDIEIEIKDSGCHQRMTWPDFGLFQRVNE